MKKIISIVLVLVLMATLMTACGENEQDVDSTISSQSTTEKDDDKEMEEEVNTETEEPVETITLRCGLNNPDSHPLVQGMFRFNEILMEKSGGKYEIEFFTGGQLGDKTTQMQSLQTGALDMYMIMPGEIANYGVDEMNVLNLPYLFDSVEHARAVYETELGQELLDSIQARGSKMVGIGMYQEAARNFFFVEKPVTTIADLEGMKMRVPSSPIYVELMETFGASATPIAFGELYSALQTGVVDGAEQPYSGYYANSFHEIAKYYVKTGHQISPNMILMSEITYEAMSEEDQNLIKEAFAESKEYFRELSERSDEEIIAKLLEQDVQILEVDDMSEWQEKAAPLHEKYGEQFKDIIDIIKTTEY